MEHFEIKKQILDEIKKHDVIIILRHVRPDGDCMGASIGLREMLRTSFPEKKVYSLGLKSSDYLNFLGLEDSEDDILLEDKQKALYIVVDTSIKSRIDYDVSNIDSLIKIDHHLPVDNYGSINYVRVDYGAASAMIADFYNTFRNELKLNEKARIALYTGIVTDTGRFKYSRLNEELFKVVSVLLEEEIDIENIYSNLYLKDIGELKLSAYVYSKFKTTPNGVSYIYMSKKIQKKFKVSPEEAASLVNLMEGIKGNLIWAMFIEADDGTWRVRLRSRAVAINEIAEAYRGGGHKQASGATVLNKKEAKELLRLADSHLEIFKKENPGVN